MPIIARLSRNIYINFFIDFNKNWNKSSWIYWYLLVDVKVRYFL
jgi:uncharacterized membrane protein (DUF106 family)